MGLNRNQQKVLAALLIHGTAKEAAAACGLAERTVYGYLANDAFTAELQKRQDAILAGVVAKMTTLAGAGMAQLEGALGVLDAHTRANVGRFITVNEKGNWDIDLTSATEADMALIRKLETDRRGEPKIEVYDSQRAADRLGHLVLSLIEGRRKQAELEEVLERVAALEAQVGAGR